MKWARNCFFYVCLFVDLDHVLGPKEQLWISGIKYWCQVKISPTGVVYTIVKQRNVWWDNTSALYACVGFEKSHHCLTLWCFRQYIPGCCYVGFCKDLSPSSAYRSHVDAQLPFNRSWQEITPCYPLLNYKFDHEYFVKRMHCIAVHVQVWLCFHLLLYTYSICFFFFFCFFN